MKFIKMLKEGSLVIVIIMLNLFQIEQWLFNQVKNLYSATYEGCLKSNGTV